MIIFKKIQYKNFLSTGNQFNTVHLNEHKSTLITGKNGDGKSTILCALTFVLFGKPFRNVNKNQLINSINKKNCLVEIDFHVNGQDYTVRRGIKPNVFEIICNGSLINQDAALKDYQKVLEQQILKLNYKTFTQVVILGSATFVPFMQLPALQRREVIEDILDIKVFSQMNALLKEQATAIKESLASVDNQISNQKIRISGQKKFVELLETNRKSLLDTLNQKIASASDTIAEHQSAITDLQQEVKTMTEKLSRYSDVAESLEKLAKIKAKTTAERERCVTDVEFFNNNETCPTCTQHIDHQHKENVLTTINSSISDYTERLSQFEQILTKLQKRAAIVDEINDMIQDKNIEISTHNNTISVLNTQIKQLGEEKETISVDTSNLVVEKQKLREYAEQAIELVEQKTRLLDQRQLHDVAALLLKDTGIKTSIIRDYLAVMNKLINKYLASMDFYVKFELDESFQEVIKSRNRDVFSYASFSEGEKQKINLAILLMWRQIAKMKNSVNTNLLIMDEVFDSSLDSNAVELVAGIMDDTLAGLNVFVISHRETITNYKFDSRIVVKKVGDFSVIQGLGD